MFGTSNKNNVTIVVTEIKKENKDISGNSFSKKMSYQLVTEIVNNALRNKK
jgi:hypothetical protein